MRLAATITAAVSLFLPASVAAHWKPGIHNTRHAINLAFCGRSNSYCYPSAQAWIVSGCESGHSVWARNGQFLGLFQMGSWERSTFGHGWNPWAQAFAAARYFVASGRDWSPWQCRPWM